MGNWTRVKIVGTCDEKEVGRLRAVIQCDRDYSNLHCLSHTAGICGLPNWGAPVINAAGNLAERDYEAKDIAETLEELAKTAPSLNVLVHVGGDHESSECVATITLEGGKATIGEPQVSEIPRISEQQMQFNLFSQLRR